jgi:hypothetical protein
VKDTITGMMLVLAMVAFFATAGALVEWWDSTWREAVSPVRSQIYSARIGPSPCLSGSYWWWRSAGCRVI